MLLHYNRNVRNDLRVNFSGNYARLKRCRKKNKNYIPDRPCLPIKALQLLITSFSDTGADFEEVLRMEATVTRL